MSNVIKFDFMPTLHELFLESGSIGDEVCEIHEGIYSSLCDLERKYGRRRALACLGAVVTGFTGAFHKNFKRPE